MFKDTQKIQKKYGYISHLTLTLIQVVKVKNQGSYIFSIIKIQHLMFFRTCGYTQVTNAPRHPYYLYDKKTIIIYSCMQKNTEFVRLDI